MSFIPKNKLLGFIPKEKEEERDKVSLSLGLGLGVGATSGATTAQRSKTGMEAFVKDLPEKAGEFIGATPLGEATGLALSRLSPEIKEIEKKIDEGTASIYELEMYKNSFGNAPTTKEIVASCGSIVANLLLFTGGAGFISKGTQAVGKVDKLTKLGNALNQTINKIPGVGKVVKFVPWKESIRLSELTTVLGATDAIMDGENINGVVGQAAVSGITGFVLPSVIKGAGIVIKKALNSLPRIFSITSGGSKRAFEFQLKNPQQAKLALEAGKNSGDIAMDGQKAVNILRQKASTQYKSDLGTLKKMYPKKLYAPEMTSGVQKSFNNQIQNIFKKTGADFDITVTKSGQLVFKRGGRISPIAKGTEQKRIMEIYKAIQRWKDYSPEGSSKLLNYLNVLRRYETTAGTRESMFVGRVLDEVKKIIFKNYPGMEGLFNNYATHMNLYNNADKMFKATKAGDAQSQIIAARNVLKIFDDNKEPLFRVAEELEKVSGISLIKEASVAELEKAFPAMIRSVLGVAGAVTAFFRPQVLLMLPFFTQTATSWMTRMAGFAIQAGPTIGKTITPFITKGILSQVEKETEK